LDVFFLFNTKQTHDSEIYLAICQVGPGGASREGNPRVHNNL
jgi:hypothetical protein